MANKNSRNQTPPGSDANKLPGYELNNTTLEGWHTIHLTQKDVINAHLPIELCDSEHYIIGHLLITQGYNSDKLESHKTVGQTLIVSTCGTAPSIYRRSSSKLNGVPSWSKWESGESNSLTWKEASHIDMFTTPGVFNIEGKRINRNDGLPIYNKGTISARLVVLEGGNCITQVLTLLNTGGGDSNIYVRTKQDGAWKPWGKLQTNIEVGAIGLGQSRTFDDLTDNGIYSGVNVYATGTDTNGYPITSYETFVLVVINAYLTGGGITQLKYSLLLNGTTNVNTRTKLSGSWGNWVDLGAATTTDIQDGAITAQKLSSDVRTKVENPLRPLYIAAGAEYNDSGADKTKTAPWGETVTHKAGHYYLNGLGDITEEQMSAIYAANYYTLSENISCLYFQSKIRTNICKKGTGWNSGNSTTSARLAFYNSSLEVAVVANPSWPSDDVYCFQAGDVATMFDFCSSLKRIVGVMNMRDAIGMNSMLQRCPELLSVKIKGLKNSIDIKNSPNFSKESVIYMLENATPTSAITITLHLDAYALLADDAEIVAALEAQPLVSLVSA